MNIQLMAKAARAFLKAKIFRKRTPLVVGWAITDRCNRRCSYCQRWQGTQNELTTEDVFSVVDGLRRMGTALISLTGGEPLVRNDIGQIIDYIHDRGILVKLNSNGMLVEEKINELKNLHSLTLSLEGSEKVHDAIRGKDSYRQVMQAARTARQNAIKVNITTVLTANNLDAIDFVLEKARELQARVTFQPATETILGSTSRNPLAPPVGDYRRAIRSLAAKKKSGRREIANSITGLKHLYHYPEPKTIRCACSWISCRIEPNGDVMYCSRGKTPPRMLNCLEHGVETAVNNLSAIRCHDCWCAGRVELNLAFSLNPSVILNQVESIRRNQ